MPDRDAPKEVICDETMRACVDRYRSQLQALVLTGSLARNEATFVKERGGWSVLGDAEFLLMFDKSARLPAARNLNPVVEVIEARLLQQGLVCRVSVSAAHIHYLERLRPHIFAYELRTNGQVVWGDSNILSVIPEFSQSEIPPEDAWWLLCNRIIELLEMIGNMGERPARMSAAVQYRTVKLFLDMTTSYLVFAGAYEPTYKQRARKVQDLAEIIRWQQAAPFPLDRFADWVQRCTRAKLTGSFEEEMTRIGFLEEAAAYARILCRWELCRLTVVADQPSTHILFARMMRAQPMSQRVRGWACVVRNRGWHWNWREWARWGRLCWRASPRYWVYAAACELFDRLSCVMKPGLVGHELDERWERLRKRLPETRVVQAEQNLPAWRRLLSAIIRNYREFIEHTRA